MDCLCDPQAQGSSGSTLGNLVVVADEVLWRDPQNTARQTRAWFRYQDECIAHRCIPNLFGNEIEAIVTEWALDYVVVLSDETFELVSVKHREPNVHSWTMYELRRERVLIDLHRVWTEMHGVGRYAFESSTGFSGPDARAILDACIRRQASPINKAVPILAKHLQIKPDEAASFLASLSLRSPPLPRRNEMSASNRDLLRTVLRKSGLSLEVVDECYADLLQQVQTASTDGPPTDGVRLERLMGMMEKVASASARPEIDEHTLRIADLRRRIYRIHSARMRESSGPGRRQQPPLPDPLFVGRSAELRVLKEHSCLCQPQLVSPIVIQGITGIGKTFLASEFAARQRERFDFALISGSTRPALIEGLRSIALLGGDASGVSGPARLDDPTLILIIDGVTDPNVIGQLISRRNLTRVIITTTCRHLDDSYTYLSLEGWRREDSLRYIGAHAGPEKNEDDFANDLARTLHDHPLALTQAVNYSKAEGLSTKDYLDRFGKRPSELLTLGASLDHPISVHEAVILNLEAAREKDPNSFDLLSMLSYMDSAPVPETLFNINKESVIGNTRWVPQDYPRTEIVTRDWRSFWLPKRRTIYRVPSDEACWELKRTLSDQSVRDAAISVLHRYALATRQPGGLVTHPLIRLICRSVVSEEADSLLAIVLALFKEVFESPGGPDVDMLLPHFAQALEHADELGVNGPIVLAGHERVSEHLREVGDVESAIAHGEAAVSIAEARAHGTSLHSSALRTLSAAYVFSHSHAKAAEIAIEALAIASETHYSLAEYGALADLAHVFLHAGRFDEANSFIDKLSCLPLPTGAELEATFILTYLRASILIARDKLVDAQPLIDELLSSEFLDGQRSDANFERGLVLDAQATLLRGQGRAEEAARVSAEAMAVFRTRRQEKPDIHVVNQIVNTIHADLDAGDVSAAEEHLMEAKSVAESLRIQETVFYGHILSAQGRILVRRGRPREAVQPLEQAISLLRHEDSGYDADIAVTLHHLAHGYAAERRFEKAIQAAVDARDHDADVYGSDHHEVVKGEQNLAAICVMASRWTLAIAALNRCLKILESKEDEISQSTRVEVESTLAALRRSRRS